MKTFKTSSSIVLGKKNIDRENINIFGGRSVFFNTPKDIESLNVPPGNSAIFLNEDIKILKETEVLSGELLLVDGDVRLHSDLVVQSGGEFRVL